MKLNRAKEFVKLIEDTSEGHKPEISRYGKCPPGYKWSPHYKRCFPDDRTNKESHDEDLWPASKPGFSPGISATTQLIPEQDSWKKQAQEKARWAIEYGKTKGYTSIVQDGMEVLKMIRDGLDQSDVLRSNAYQTAVKVWGK